MSEFTARWLAARTGQQSRQTSRYHERVLTCSIDRAVSVIGSRATCGLYPYQGGFSSLFVVVLDLHAGTERTRPLDFVCTTSTIRSGRVGHSLSVSNKSDITAGFKSVAPPHPSPPPREAVNSPVPFMCCRGATGIARIAKGVKLPSLAL